MLELYKIQENYNNLSDKSIVLLSAGFLRNFNTMTNNKLFDLLHENYHVFGIDNAGHGIENTKTVNIIGQQQVLLENIININNNIHIISNSLPGLLTLHGIYGILKEKAHIFNIKSITLLSPTINLKNALKYGYNKRDIAEYIIKQKNNDTINKSIELLYKNIPCVEGLVGSELENYDYNLRVMIELNKKVPIHIVGNTNDNMLIDNNFSQLTGNLNNNHIAYTFEDSNKHSININNNFNYSNIVYDFQSDTIGSIIKEFIKINDQEKTP